MSSQIQITGETKVKSLTGVLVGTSGVVSSLNIDGSLGIPQLDVNGKILVSQLPNSVMEYKGTWDASTNTPTLVNGTGNQGDVYLCNVAGTVNFGAGAIAFFVGDQVIYSGSIWQRASGATGTVTSVAITETGDSLNITGSPITTSGTINIGFNGTNLQYINGAGDLTTFPTLSGYVTSVTGTAPVVSSGGTTPAISMAAATASVDGYLDNADWSTFNAKQNAITLTTTGTSGASTLVGATLNIPNYGSALTGYVPYTGATQDVDLGAFNLTADVITGATGSFTSNGGSNTFSINHSSGAGIALNITKGGNGEGLYINKTSGSGNAATIVGTLNATTLVKSGGTSSQFLKADGSVDSTTYGTGSVTSVAALTLGTSGTDLSSTVATSTTTPVITLNVPTASATNRGALSSVDWSTFNGKESVLTFSSPLVRTTNTISIPVATTSVNGYLSSTDWTTFNNKQNALTNPITGTGTTNRIARFSGSTTLTDSYITDAAGTATIINKDGSSITAALVSIYPATGTNASILNLDNSGAGSFYIGRQNSAGNSQLISSLDAYASVIGHTSTQTLNFVTASLSRLAIDGSGNSVFSGSLKIGGSTTAKQFVVNQGTTSGYFLSGEASGTELAYWYYNTTEIQFSSKSSTRALQFLTSDTTRLTIASTGAATFSSSLAATTLTLNTTTSGYAATITNVEDASQGLLIRATDNDTTQYLLNLQSSNTTTGQTWVDRFAVTKGGNIGIGIINPASKISISVPNTYTSRGSFANSALNILDPTDVGVYSQITFGYEPSRTYAAAYMGYLSTSNSGGGFGDLVFGTRPIPDIQPTERFRVLSSGLFLINTSTGVSGGGTLQVNGDVNINGNFKINGTIIGGGGGSGVTGSGTSGYVTKWTGASTLGNSIIQDNGTSLSVITSGEIVARFATSGDGTIIIGGTSAQGVSSGEQYITYQNGTTNTNAWMVGMDDGEDWRFAYGAQGEITDANSLIRLTQGGNLIIGSVTDAGYKLQVNGSLYVSGTSVYAGGVTYSGTQTFNGLVYLNNTTEVANGQFLQFNDATFGGFSIKTLGASGGGASIVGNMTLLGGIINTYGYTQTFNGNGSSAYNVVLSNSGIAADQLTMLGGLRLDTTTAGFIPPRMTTTQKNALPASVKIAGCIVYDTTSNLLQAYNGSTWNNLW